MKSFQITGCSTAGSVTLNLTHSVLTMKIPEIRFELDQTIGDIKKSVERRFGSDSNQMELILQDNNGNNIAAMTENDRTLESYCPQDYYTIHVLDLNPNSITRELEDVSQVEKYVMSNEDYNKLPDTFRKWKEKLMQSKPELFKKPDATGTPTIPVSAVVNAQDFMKEEAEAIAVGSRCKLNPEGHRGAVKYVGKVTDLDWGYFIGVQLDEPFGQNDGKFNGTTYFTCPNKYGCFRRPNTIEVGDFPVLDIDDEI